jgi:uncharacterized membrane protein
MTNRKISNQFRELLKQELSIWQTDGLISAEQSAALSQKYRLDQMQKESTRLLLFVIYIIGAVLVGAGVISFVAANWESIPAAAKVAMIVALMVACHLIGYYLWRISARSPRLGHALVVLGTLVFGANIGLMAQIFHIKSNFYNGLFAWAVGAVIMAYAIRSVPNAIIAILVWFIGFCSGVEDYERAFAFLPFVAAAVFLPFAYLNRSVPAFLLSSLAAGFAVVIYVWHSVGGLASYGVVAPGLALLFFGWGLVSARTARFHIFGSPAMIIGAIFIAFGAYISSFKQYGLGFPDLLKERLWLVPTIAAYLLGIAAWLAAIKQVLSDTNAKWIAAGLFVSSVLVAASVLMTPMLMSSPDSFWCTVYANVACFILAAALVANSFVLLDRRIFWAGVMFIALVIASRFLEYKTGLLIKAVIFIVCGIGIILAGVGFENYLKKRRIANE